MVWRADKIPSEADTLRLRFSSKVIVASQGCWIWQAGKSKGYGIFHIHRAPIAAQRAAFLLYKGIVPEGMLVCHTCDTPLCVNPEHLFLGTPSENSRDMVIKGRSARGEKHAMAKLTEELVLEIRATPGISKEVAKKFGVDSSLIRMIRRRDIWSHI